MAKGIEIYESLRGHTTGFAVPTYIIDALGGGGKMPVFPNYIISQAPGQILLRNYEGVISKYTEPKDYVDGQCQLRGLHGEEAAAWRGRSLRQFHADHPGRVAGAPAEGRGPQEPHGRCLGPVEIGPNDAKEQHGHVCSLSPSE